MWVLIVMSLNGSTASTQSSLKDCEREIQRVVEAQQAYCKSAFSNEVIWFIKDGRRLIKSDAFE